MECTKPTVAAAFGWAMGGGCELALACDVRIAADDLRIGMPEAKRGLGANFGSVVLPRVVPVGLAYQMLYTGEPLDAQDALRWGLVQSVVPRDELADRAEAEPVPVRGPQGRRCRVPRTPCPELAGPLGPRFSRCRFWRQAVGARSVKAGTGSQGSTGPGETDRHGH